MVTLCRRKRRYELKLKGTNHSDNFDKGCFVPDVNVSKFDRKLNSGNKKESRNYLKLDIIPPLWGHEIAKFSEVSNRNN